MSFALALLLVALLTESVFPVSQASGAFTRSRLSGRAGQVFLAGFPPDGECVLSEALACSREVHLNFEFETTSGPEGHKPAEIQEAYGIPTTGGSGQTIAIVDPGDDPNAEEDLKHFRTEWKLGECTEANGCFRKTDSKGGTSYPSASTSVKADVEAAGEISIDLDMASVACEQCHIVLVEAPPGNEAALYESINEAVTLGATEVSISWGLPEDPGASTKDKYLEHPGVPIAVAAGDYGYDSFMFTTAGGAPFTDPGTPFYPATDSYKEVVAVGGTVLTKAEKTPRGWTDTVWQYSDSGCSENQQPRPAWQPAAGCPYRLDNDVSIVAEDVTEYDSWGTGGTWGKGKGTSVGAPLIAGLLAHATEEVRKNPAEAFYKDLEEGIGTVLDVVPIEGKTNDNNPLKAVCEHEYECNAIAGEDGNAIKGYDGPTGVGVPQGVPTLAKWGGLTIPSSSSFVDEYRSIACSTFTSCIAVGFGFDYGATHITRALAAQWNGTKWSRLEPPYASGTPGYEYLTILTGVACPATNTCFADGEQVTPEGAPMVFDRWNGTSWSTETKGKAGSGYATGSVACPSSSFCIAVGEELTETYERLPVAAVWSGSSWSLAPLPSPAGADRASLLGVACVSASFCYASGTHCVEFSNCRPLVEIWNGAAWSIAAGVEAPGGVRGKLDSIACSNENSCTAVGEYGEELEGENQLLVERWDGTTWKATTAPLPSGATAGALESVSCAGPSACTAIGFAKQETSNDLELIENWNGTAWEVAANHGLAGSGWLEAVDCTELVACIVVGGSESPSVPAAKLTQVEALGPPTSPERGVGSGTSGNPGAPGVRALVRGSAVNCASGDESTVQSDLTIGGRGPGLSAVRSYDAQASVAAQAEEEGPGGWGPGWTGPYGAHLAFGTSGAGQETITVDQQNGSAVVFYKKEGGGYEQGGWVQARLAKEGSDYVYTLPDQTKLEFSGEGRLLKESDRSGNTTTVTYNGSKQIEKVTDSGGRALTYKYNEEGLVESIKDPLGHVVSYTYVAKGGLSTVSIEGKVRWEFEYTTSAPYLLKGVTDGRGHTVTREYDGAHRVTEELIGGHERKWSYASNETTITEPNGAITVATFNSADEPTKVVEAQGTGIERTTEYEYASTTFNLTKLTDPNKHSTEYEYDEEGNRTSEKSPVGDERQWEYDKDHDVVKETTPEGEVTKTKLTETGLPEVVERPAGGETEKTEYKYDAYGDVTEAIDPLGNKTKYSYDSNGDKQSEKDAEGHERKWKYDEDSQGIEETSPRGYVTKTERNDYGLPTKITDPLGHTTETKYDANQNVESETDGNKHTTKYEYNAENLPIKETKPNGDITETGYDTEGKKTSYTDGSSHTWEYKRNKLEQITEEKDPLGKTTKKTYTKAGDLETVEDPEKHTTTYGYDSARRLTARKYSTGKPSEVTYGYNKDNKGTEMKDDTGSTENTWDKLDRLTEYKNGAGKTVKYEYNLSNLPVKMTYPNGKAVAREYDKDNRLSKVTDWKSHATSFKYDADSKLTSSTFPAESEDKDEYAYNAADQMTEDLVLWKGSAIAGAVYERDGDGQVTKTFQKWAEGKEPEAITSVLDENNRLIEYNGHAYTYDKGDNPTKIEGEAGYTYNEADQLKESPTAKYKYNEDGRRTKLEPKTGEPATTYGWDQAGHLTSFSREKGAKQTEVTESTSYDANGLAQELTFNGTKYKTAWDTAEPLPVALEDENNAGEEEAAFIYGPENRPIEEAFGANSIYFHHDQQGSTRLVTYWQYGEIVGWKSYGPYGNTTETAGDPTPLAYDGRPTDPETGLVWFGARRYDTSTGQFTSNDPLLITTENPYNFAQDNPENAQTEPKDIPPPEP